MPLARVAQRANPPYCSVLHAACVNKVPPANTPIAP
jgi:hypothetical protein